MAGRVFEVAVDILASNRSRSTSKIYEHEEGGVVWFGVMCFLKSADSTIRSNIEKASGRVKGGRMPPCELGYPTPAMVACSHHR